MFFFCIQNNVTCINARVILRGSSGITNVSAPAHIRVLMHYTDRVINIIPMTANITVDLSLLLSNFQLALSHHWQHTATRNCRQQCVNNTTLSSKRERGLPVNKDAVSTE